MLLRLNRIEEITNGNRNRLVVGEINGETIITQAQQFGPMLKNTVQVWRSRDDHVINRVFMFLRERGKVRYLRTEDVEFFHGIEKAYSESETDSEIRISGCIEQVETTENESRQNEVLKGYYEGEKNHRGVAETLWCSGGRTIRWESRKRSIST